MSSYSGHKCVSDSSALEYKHTRKKQFPSRIHWNCMEEYSLETIIPARVRYGCFHGPDNARTETCTCVKRTGVTFNVRLMRVTDVRNAVLILVYPKDKEYLPAAGCAVVTSACNYAHPPTNLVTM